MQCSRILRYAQSGLNRFFHTKPSVSIHLEGNKASLSIIQLPQKNFVDFLGDRHANKLPINDLKKNNPLYCLRFQLFNSNVHLLNPVSILEDAITQVKVPFPNLIKTIILPTTEENFDREKKADYYKHRDPKRFTHLTWVRHRKMKKHQRIKWRKKNLARIKRRILERNIAKEKLFRAELLAQIKEAEEFDPRAYVENILYTIDSVPQLETPQQKLERYKDLIRKNRTQTNLVMPKFEKID